MTKISNCGRDEKNGYTGGAVGDQTGGEWEIRDWYPRPWNCVMRAKDKKVRKAHAAKAKAIGRQLGIEALKNIKATYTGDMRSCYRDTGEYEILTDPKYLITSDYLLEGYILLNDSHHVTTNLEDGAKASETGTTGGDYMFSVGDVKTGSTGNDVKLLQRLLKSNGCKGADNKNLTIDGQASDNTITAIKKYQKKKV